jgi:beta-lactamase regulating signal transducer with metallopeptidase domain
MPTPLLPLVLAKATLVLVAALAAARLLQRASAGTRHVVWLVTLGALLLVVPALAAWAPLRLAVLPALPVVTASAAAPDATAFDEAITDDEAVAGDARDADAPAPSTPAAAPQPVGASAAAAWRPALAPALLALWAAVALAIGGALARAWLAVRRILRRARPLDGHDWLVPLYEVADRLGLDEAPRLVRSEDARMPFACGVARPTIVLPAESDGWTLDRRRAVLLHELAHVRRRDLVGHTLARVACTVWWFHPLVWTAARRLRAESERACDDLALACGARPADYAEHLLDIVTSVRGDATPITALAMARRTEFEGRMLDILDPERPRAAPSRRQTAALTGALALVTVVVSAAAPAPRAAAPAASAPPSEAAAPTPPPSVAVAPRSNAPDAAPPSPERASPEFASSALALPSHDETDGPWKPNKADKDKADKDKSDEVKPDKDKSDKPKVSAGGYAVSVDATTETNVLMRETNVVTRMLARGGQPPRADERATLLARVLRTDTSASLRRVAAWGLAEYADQSAAAEALAEALRRDGDGAVREMAAWALADADDAGRDALLAALRDASVRVRATAAWALADAGDRSSVEPLAAALADTSARVRARAAWAIGNLEPRAAPRALVALLQDREPSVRRVAAWALYEIEDPTAATALQVALRGESDKELQVAYIRALGAMGERSVDALRGLLESSDANVRAVAVRALAGGNAAGPWPWPWPDPRPHP